MPSLQGKRPTSPVLREAWSTFELLKKSEVVFTYIMELEDEGVLNVYEQMLADTTIFAVYHALCYPRHPQAQVAMRSWRDGLAHLKAGGNRPSPL